LTPSFFNCFTCDYNPPPLLFPTDAQQAANATAFNNQLNGLLSSLDNAANTATLNQNQVNNNTNNVPSINFIKAQRSQADIQFATLSGDPDFTDLLDGISKLSFLLLITDYIYRGYRSIALFVKYWFGSAVGLPDIEISKQKSAKISEPCGVRFLQLLTSPVFILIVVAVLLFGLVYVIFNFYLPLVNSYVDGCGNAQQENGPGTLLSTNANALIYNQAVGGGQKQMQNYLTDYDTLRQNICGQYYTQTGNTLEQLQQLYNQVLNDYANAVSALQLMASCMDPASVLFDFVNQTNCVALDYRDSTGNPVPFTYPGNVYWDDLATPCGPNDLIATNLTDMIFNCSNVALCTQFSVCTNSVDKDSLAQGAWKASCDTEKLLIIGVTNAAMSILIYILWNLGRVLLVMGLGRLLWRNLVPHGFNYVATCSSDGKIERDTEKEVAAKLKSVIASFERMGAILIFAALFIQLFWLIPIVFFATEIASINS